MAKTNIPSFNAAVEKYRHLDLILKYLNLAYSQVIYPSLEYIVVAIVVLAFVGAFRIHGVIRYALGIIAFICYMALLITFRSAAVFHKWSQIIRYRWRTFPVDKNIQRLYKNLRELKLMMGSFGFVDTTHILTITGIILDSSISFLIIKQ
jgi:hypothetical protein